MSSPECPHLQLHDVEVVSFREAAVVEGVTGATPAQVQHLIQPQAKVTTSSSNSKRVQVSLYEEGVFSGPLETLEARKQHEEECLSCAVEGLARPQRVREEAPKHLIK